MKWIVLSLLIFIAAGLALTSCNRHTKKENMHIITEDRPVKGFTQISVEGIFPVELSQDGGAEWVKVEADEKLQHHIIVSVANDKLSIDMDDEPTVNQTGKMKVYINLKDINELTFKSVGALSTAGQLKLDSLEVNSESVGKLTLDVDAKFLRTNLNSVGATTLKGRVGEARINNKSVGTLSAYDLKAGTLMIHNTAIGTAEVYADSAFYIRSSAIGMLSYKGPGVVKELSSEGIGKVKKAD